MQNKFSVPQIEYPLGDSSKKGSHIFFLLQVFWVILFFSGMRIYRRSTIFHGFEAEKMTFVIDPDQRIFFFFLCVWGGGGGGGGLKHMET